MFVPIAWAVSTSFKNPGDIFLIPPTWIPNPIRWQNYVEAMTTANFARYFLNTAFITLVDIVAKVLSCSLVAFAFSRMRWWGRDVLFMVMLSTLMLPQQVTLIPQFIVYRWLGWVDTFLPLIIPNLFGGPFFTFLLRQFFLSIPTDLDDAARIDGCSSWGVYWRIIMPLSKPALMMVAIFVFNYTWNDFFGPLIYLHSNDNFTISLGLQAFQTQAGPQWHLIMAASLVAMLPVLILFFVGQRYFIQGVVFSGVKG
ncbi:MAG: carbohydrate ABC transporter permease [Chloroflexi bacterium]|nr:carbohydrate ABC transporter permease [Chloroflexota bacterium]